RENLGKFRSMPLRPLIDLSVNQTLGRTVATSMTVILSILPLALIGGEVMRGFALAIIFGIIIGHLFIHLHRLADSAVPRRKTTAARSAPSLSRKQFCRSPIDPRPSAARSRRELEPLPRSKRVNPGKSLGSSVVIDRGTVGY